MRTTSIALALLVASAGACSDFLAGSKIDVALQVSAVDVAPDAPLTITVTATNTGDEAVVWGHGSSSCQLRAVALGAGEQYRTDERFCTDDFVPQGLEPGQTRTETWTWNAADVPSGTYQVVGLAGNEARSKGETVRRLE